MLLPQIAAWIYGDRAKSRPRAVWMWALFTLARLGAGLAAGAAGFPFHLWIVALASATHRRLVFSSGTGRLGISRQAIFLVQGRNVRHDRSTFLPVALRTTRPLRRVKDFASANKIANRSHRRTPASAVIS